MKKYLVIFAGLVLSATAFAQTYECGPLRNKAGQAIVGGPKYAVEADGPNVFLNITTGAIAAKPTTEAYRMEVTQTEPDGTVYQAQGVTASLFVTPEGGKARTTVSITKKIGALFYQASCE